jgi:hypothetical protein
MRRLFPLALVFAAFAFAGCQPQDPFDWKISAGSPDAYDVWIERHYHLLPPELQHDFNQAFAFLRSDTATRLGTIDPAPVKNRLCLRLDGKSIRALIMEADELESDALRIRISLTVDDIVRNTNASESLAGKPADLLRLAEARAGQEAAIGAMRGRLAEIDAQVRELSPGRR